MALWSRGPRKLCDNLKTSYLHYHSSYGYHGYLRGSFPKSRMTLGLRPLYLHCRSAYGHQAREDLTWGTPTQKTIWPFDHAFLQDHMPNKKYYIFTTTVTTAPHLAVLWLTMRSSHPYYNMILSSRSLVMSRDRLNNLQLHVQETNGCQNKVT